MSLLACIVVGEMALTHVKDHVNQGGGKENTFFSHISSVSCTFTKTKQNWQDRVFFAVQYFDFDSKQQL